MDVGTEQESGLKSLICRSSLAQIQVQNLLAFSRGGIRLNLGKERGGIKVSAEILKWNHYQRSENKEPNRFWDFVLILLKRRKQGRSAHHKDRPNGLNSV